MNLLIKFYEKWIPRVDFIEKKNLTVNLAYLIKPHFRICIDSPLTKFQLLNNEYRYWSQIFSKRVKLILFLGKVLSAPTRNRVDKRLGSELQIWAKAWKPQEVQKLGVFLNSKRDQEIVENMLQRNCYLEIVTLDLFFISP